MKKISILIIGLILLACETESNSAKNDLEGKTYNLSGFIIEAEVDLNNDGVFSNNLIIEDQSNCLENDNLNFTDTEVDPIFKYAIEVDVQNENGTAMQTVGCTVIDYFRLASYRVENNRVILFFDEDIQGIGTINGNSITFNLETTSIINQYINANGIVTDYNGGLTLVYTLEN